MIRVGLCDDDDLVRRLLPESLGSEDIEVIITCRSGEETLECGVDVDVWLVDLRMPGLDGRETAALLVRERPGVKVMILTAFDDGRVRETLEAGASAHLHKDVTPDTLRHAIRTVMGGCIVVAPGAPAGAFEQSVGEKLLTQIKADAVDRRIVCLMSAGRSYEQMAHDIGMSVSGTKKRAAKLMVALGVSSRSQIVAKLNGFEA